MWLPYGEGIPFLGVSPHVHTIDPFFPYPPPLTPPPPLYLPPSECPHVLYWWFLPKLQVRDYILEFRVCQPAGLHAGMKWNGQLI